MPATKPRSLTNAQRTARLKTLRHLLCVEGLNCPAVAKKLRPSVSARRVRELADAHQLPLNLAIPPGSKLEADILRLINLGFQPSDVGLVHRQATCRIREVISRVANLGNN